MELFYFTFSKGQVNVGHVQPIFAEDKETATKIMDKKYNGHWCWQYTAEEWEDNKKELLEMNVPYETELRPIIQRGDSYYEMA